MQAWYPEPSDVQLLSTWHVSKVHLLQKFRRIEKKKNIDVNFYINVLFRICMSLISLQATCHFIFNKSGYTFPFEYTHFSRE
jgi:hypothetical protein